MTVLRLLCCEEVVTVLSTSMISDGCGWLCGDIVVDVISLIMSLVCGCSIIIFGCVCCDDEVGLMCDCGTCIDVCMLLLGSVGCDNNGLCCSVAVVN